MTTGWVYAIVVVGVVAAVSFLVTKQDTDTGDGSPMPDRWRRVLIAYLLSVGFVLMFMLTSLTAVEFPNTFVQLAPEESRAAPPADAQAGSGPVVLEIIPEATLASTPTTFVAVYGRNFTESSKVRFNRRERAVIFAGPDLLKAQLQPEDVVGQGSIMVDVVDGNVASTALILTVLKPRVPLNVFGWWHPWVTQEVQLFLLVLCAGALGSYVHALKSLADFIGNRTLTASWFWWYITRPFLGMAMALVFYALLRGGFLAGTPADARIVNPFGVIAVGALVGMFADKAAQKLAEIFDTLFKSADTRSGKLDAPVIDAIIPDTIVAGTPNAIVLTIRGDRLGTASVVRLNAEERKPETVTEQELTVTLGPEDLKDARRIKVTAVNSEGSVSSDATLDIVASDLAISTRTLPPAVVNAPYSQTVTASGGTAPYRWALITGPAWLTIDEASGILTGTPAAAGKESVVIRVQDSAGIVTISPELLLAVA